MKIIATVSTYGPTNYGCGHDITTRGVLTEKDRISIHDGTPVFMNLLEKTALKHKLQRGDKVIISIEPKIKKKK